MWIRNVYFQNKQFILIITSQLRAGLLWAGIKIIHHTI